MDVALAALLAAIGLGAGVLSTLFGIGGGIAMVPVLHYGLGVEWPHATAISLAAIAVMSPSGVLAHARRGAVDWRLAIPLAVGGILGVLAGDWLQPRTPVPWLKLLFAGLMVLAAVRLVHPGTDARWHTRQPILLGLVGVGAGIVSKLLGVGGGILTVPVLTLTGTPIHVAVGSSLVPVFTNAAQASATHLAQGVALWWALPLAAGGLAGIPLGARIAHSLADLGLRQVFAAALVLAAVLVAATSGAF